MADGTPRPTADSFRHVEKGLILMPNDALSNLAPTGIYLLRGVSRKLQRTARSRALAEGTRLRSVLLRALNEYAAGTWTPQPEEARPAMEEAAVAAMALPATPALSPGL